MITQFPGRVCTSIEVQAYGPNGFRVFRPSDMVLMYPEKRCKMVLENGRFYTYFAEKEKL